MHPHAHGHDHGTHPAGIGAVRPTDWVYDRAPMMIYWELTLACALTCRHCRAKAMKRALPGELTTEQAIAVLDDITRFGGPGEPLPHIIFTGGDPLRRDDLDVLLREAGNRGIGVSLAPAVTELLTKERLQEVKDGGVGAISLSLDGSRPELHDDIRRVPGTYQHTMEALKWADEIGLPVQINTLVTDKTVDDLPAMYEMLKGQPVTRWTLFFLIQTGRGQMLQEVTPAQAEGVMQWLVDLRGKSPFRISTTEATFYRRVLAQNEMARGEALDDVLASPAAMAWGVRDGNGIVFITNKGDIQPSGFLPVSVGNVTRGDSLVDTYRSDPFLLQLRDTDSFAGKCGLCDYRKWCGGSRARAYAAFGDALGSDPLCPYVSERAREAGRAALARS